MRPLPRSFFERDTVEVARGLLGCHVTTNVGRRRTSGRIVEVEAYTGPEDPAAHCYQWRRTERTEPMFGPAGTAYVYFTYGMHWCFNVVTKPSGYPSAVLVRALEPLEGKRTMQARRGGVGEKGLCSGPAKLCQALGIDGSNNHRSLRTGPVRIAGPDDPSEVEIVTGPRIGISRATDWSLRFGVADSPWLSRKFPP